MKKVIISLLMVQALPAPVFASARLTAGEQAFAQKCRDNVNIKKRQLSADTALECVQRLTDNGGELLARLGTQSPGGEAAAAELLSLNNALIDLKNIVTQYSMREMRKHLTRVLEKSPCHLCVMELGPRPEMIFDWVGREAGSRLLEVKRAVRTWENLEEIRIRSLSSAEYKYGPERWNAKTIAGRIRTLSKWAANETDKLTAVYGKMTSLGDNKPDPLWLRSLREDLAAGDNKDYLAKLDRLEARLARMGNGEGGDLSQ